MSLTVALQTDPAGSFQGVDNGQALIFLYFTVTAANAPANYNAGGDTLNFIASSAIADFIKSGRPPLQCTIWSQKAGGGSGFVYGFTPAAANPSAANGKMQVFTGAAAQSPLTELANGNYPAGVLGDTIVGCAVFPRV